MGRERAKSRHEVGGIGRPGADSQRRGGVQHEGAGGGWCRRRSRPLGRLRRRRLRRVQAVDRADGVEHPGEIRPEVAPEVEPRARRHPGEFDWARQVSGKDWIARHAIRSGRQRREAREGDRLGVERARYLGEGGSRLGGAVAVAIEAEHRRQQVVVASRHRRPAHHAQPLSRPSDRAAAPRVGQAPAKGRRKLGSLVGRHEETGERVVAPDLVRGVGGSGLGVDGDATPAPEILPALFRGQPHGGKDLAVRHVVATAREVLGHESGGCPEGERQDMPRGGGKDTGPLMTRSALDGGGDGRPPGRATVAGDGQAVGARRHDRGELGRILPLLAGKLAGAARARVAVRIEQGAIDDVDAVIAAERGVDRGMAEGGDQRRGAGETGLDHQRLGAEPQAPGDLGAVGGDDLERHRALVRDEGLTEAAGPGEVDALGGDAHVAERAVGLILGDGAAVGRSDAQRALGESHPGERALGARQRHGVHRPRGGAVPGHAAVGDVAEMVLGAERGDREQGEDPGGAG